MKTFFISRNFIHKIIKNNTELSHNMRGSYLIHIRRVRYRLLHPAHLLSSILSFLLSVLPGKPFQNYKWLKIITLNRKNLFASVSSMGTRTSRSMSWTEMFSNFCKQSLNPARFKSSMFNFDMLIRLLTVSLPRPELQISNMFFRFFNLTLAFLSESVIVFFQEFNSFEIVVLIHRNIPEHCVKRPARCSPPKNACSRIFKCAEAAV